MATPTAGLRIATDEPNLSETRRDCPVDDGRTASPLDAAGGLRSISVRETDGDRTLGDRADSGLAADRGIATDNCWMSFRVGSIARGGGDLVGAARGGLTVGCAKGACFAGETDRGFVGSTSRAPVVGCVGAGLLSRGACPGGRRSDLLDVAGTEEGAVGTAEFIFGSDLGVGGADGRGGAGTPCGGTAGESVLGGADAFTTGAGADAREGTGRDSCFGSGPRVDFAPGLAVDFGFIAGAAAGDAFAEDGGVTGLPTARETGGVAGPTDFATAFGLAAGFEIVNGALIGVDGAFTVGGTALGAPFGAIDRPAGDAGFAGSGLG